MDSRIISWVLASIREKQGAEFLGDIHFRAHGTEALYGFKKLMKQQGWKKDQYSIYKPDQLEKPGCHNMGDPDNVCNGYLRPTINFWDDLIKSGDEKKYNCVQGLFGGEIFSYPLYKHKEFTDNRFNDLRINMGLGRIKLVKAYHKWHDFIMPYLGFEFLDVAFRVPANMFKWVDAACYFHLEMDKGIHQRPRDQMRLEMCNIYHDDLPYFVGHLYNLVMSMKDMEVMRDFYLNSKFYKEFSHIPQVKNATPWHLYATKEHIKEIYNNTYQLKLYGLATTYEHTKKH